MLRFVLVHLGLAWLSLGISSSFITASAADNGYSLAGPQTDVPAIWKEVLKKGPIQWEGNGPNSLFELIRTDPKEVKDIVLISLNPNLGDNIIFEYSKLESLHKKYPHAKIKIITPTSFILKKQDWLELIHVPVQEFHEPNFQERWKKNPKIIQETLEKSIHPHIQAGSLVYWDKEQFSRLWNDLLYSTQPWSKGTHIPQDVGQSEKALARHIALQGAKGLGVGDTGSLGVTVIAPTNDVVPQIASYAEKDPKRNETLTSSTGKKMLVSDIELFPEYNDSIKVESNRLRTSYERAAFQFKLYHGDDSYLSWRPEQYDDPENSKGARAALLKRSFAQPERPYVILNLNTRGKYKVSDLNKDYPQRVREFLEKMRSRFPGYNIFIVPPEPHFGKHTQAEVSKVLEQYKDRGNPIFAALLPEADKNGWKAMMSSAQAIVSQDSGFVHVANIFNKNVLTLSQDNYESGYIHASRTWRRPGQDFTEYGRKPGQIMEPAFQWLEKKLGPSSCGSDLIKNLLR